MLFFYGLNKLYFAASVYAEEHNIFHSAHLVSQGEKRPQPNLTGGVIIFSFSTGHAEVKYRKARRGQGWWGGGKKKKTVMGVIHMCSDDP